MLLCTKTKINNEFGIPTIYAVKFEDGEVDPAEAREAFKDYTVEECYGEAAEERISEINMINMVGGFALMGMQTRKYDEVKELARDFFRG